MTRSGPPPDAHPLQVALHRRAVVAHATGVVTVIRRCPADDALGWLTAAAAERRRSLVEVAAEVLAALRPGAG